MTHVSKGKRAPLEDPQAEEVGKSLTHIQRFFTDPVVGDCPRRSAPEDDFRLKYGVNFRDDFRVSQHGSSTMSLSPSTETEVWCGHPHRWRARSGDGRLLHMFA